MALLMISKVAEIFTIFRTRNVCFLAECSVMEPSAALRDSFGGRSCLHLLPSFSQENTCGIRLLPAAAGLPTPLGPVFSHTSPLGSPHPSCEATGNAGGFAAARKGFSLPLLAFSSVLLPLPSYLFLLLRGAFFTAAVPKKHGEPPAQSAFPGLTSAGSPSTGLLLCLRCPLRCLSPSECPPGPAHASSHFCSCMLPEPLPPVVTQEKAAVPGAPLIALGSGATGSPC